jgi:hypothetical protein
LHGNTIIFFGGFTAHNGALSSCTKPGVEVEIRERYLVFVSSEIKEVSNLDKKYIHMYMRIHKAFNKNDKIIYIISQVYFATGRIYYEFISYNIRRLNF